MVAHKVAERVDHQRVLFAGARDQLRGLADMRVVAQNRVDAALNHLVRGIDDVDVGVHLELPAPVAVSDDPVRALGLCRRDLLFDQGVIRRRVYIVKAHFVGQVRLALGHQVAVEVKGVGQQRHLDAVFFKDHHLVLLGLAGGRTGIQRTRPFEHVEGGQHARFAIVHGVVGRGAEEVDFGLVAELVEHRLGRVHPRRFAGLLVTAGLVVFIHRGFEVGADNVGAAVKVGDRIEQVLGVLGCQHIHREQIPGARHRHRSNRAVSVRRRVCQVEKL